MDLTKTSPFSDNFHPASSPPFLEKEVGKVVRLQLQSILESRDDGHPVLPGVRVGYCPQMALECLLMTSGGARMGVVQPSWFSVIPPQLLVPLSVLYRW